MAPRLKTALLFLALVLAGPCPAGLVEEKPLPLMRAVPAESFVEPNELHPADASPVLSRSNGGAYVAVGTERGWIGAALSRADRLILVDRDPAVVAFNRINMHLLAVAKDREDYLFLRTKATPAEWLARAKDLAAAKVLGDPFAHKWWSVNVRPTPDGDNLHFGYLHGTERSPNGAFRDANYVLDDAMFAHLQGLAQKGRVESHVLDLSSVKDVRDFVSRLKASPDLGRLGVVDLSNTWDRGFLGTEGAADVLREFRAISRGDSIAMFTIPGLWAPDVIGWGYHGATFDELAELESKRGSLSSTVRDWRNAASLVHGASISADVCKLSLRGLRRAPRPY